MQTFLVSPDFAAAAYFLDDKRLGKQRVEVIQILKALAGDYAETGAWENHPATRMWRGHERCLASYGLTICDEWKRRGFNDTCYEKIAKLAHRFPLTSAMPPEWLGDEEFHKSHQHQLYRKDPEFYAIFSTVEEREYVWPVPKEEE